MAENHSQASPRAPLHVFKRTTGAVEWFIATDEADARAIAVEMYDASEGADGTWEQMPDDRPLSIREDGPDLTTKTCGEWALEGRGCLATTED